MQHERHPRGRRERVEHDQEREPHRVGPQRRLVPGVGVVRIRRGGLRRIGVERHPGRARRACRNPGDAEAIWQCPATGADLERARVEHEPAARW